MDTVKKLEAKHERVNAIFRRERYGPVCRVLSPADIERWIYSSSYYALISYINDVSSVIQGISNTGEFPVSDSIRQILKIFDGLDALMVAYPPPVNAGSNNLEAGNRAFRRWSRGMLRNIYVFVERAVPRDKCLHVDELGQYLSTSFGNSTRLDYGIGHELNFLFFVCALFRAEILRRDEDLIASALVLFNRYLNFVRRLQVSYTVSSSNFHGAYSLDRFQFVPFIWGAAQLCLEAPFSPGKMLDDSIVQQYKTDYLLIGCVGHMAATNLGTFAYHSSQLWSLAALSSWTSIHRGLMFMYMHEILNDFDLMQSVRFGNLMNFNEVQSHLELTKIRMGVLAPLRRKVLEGDQTSMSVPPSLSVRVPKPCPKKPAVEVLSDEVSHTGMSMGSECSSLSGVSVHLPLYMDEDPTSYKKEDSFS